MYMFFRPATREEGKTTGRPAIKAIRPVTRQPEVKAKTKELTFQLANSNRLEYNRKNCQRSVLGFVGLL